MTCGNCHHTHAPEHCPREEARSLAAKYIEVDTLAKDYREEAIDAIEDALKDYGAVTRVYNPGDSDAWEIVVTFSDGSYLSFNTPEAL